MDLGLAEYHRQALADSDEREDDIGTFDLTPLGETTRNALAGLP
jgi:hypothetical protein